MGECNVIRKLFMRINSLKALEDPFIFPLTPAARKHQAIRILFATPAEGAPQAIVNFMIILWKNILISFYKVDLENQPFDPNLVWRCTLKRFADLALALAHDARTKQLLAINRGEPPPSLNSHQARLSPLATLDEEAELLFSDELHNHLIECDLTQYTAKRTQQKPTTQSDRIRQRHAEWVPEAGSTQIRHRRKRPVGSQWEP